MTGGRREFLKAAGCFGCAGALGGCALFESGLRYRSGGELHRDFHASFLDGYDYVRENYGEDAIREVMGSFARETYRSMHEKLKAGDGSELVEWWRYYQDREGGASSVSESADGATLEVRDCPARAHLKMRGIGGGERLCAATRLFNEELTRGTPFAIEMTSCGACGCRQRLVRKGAAS